MKFTEQEVLQFVEENDVKFVKLAFCDLLGRQKNLSVVSQELPSVFEKGKLFFTTVVRGFSHAGDLLLFPDPKSLTVLPWRPQAGEVVSLLSYVKRPDGSFFEGDTIHLLDEATRKLGEAGLSCEIGTECDFYVFKRDSEGNPTSIPVDRAGYFDTAPEDACENLRRDIILSLEDMGIVPTSSHHERGPGQNEIDFLPTEPTTAARNFIYFKTAVKNVSYVSGLHATFAPKPVKGNVGSGLRITLTLGGKDGSAANKKTLDAFVEGILSKSRELIAFLNSKPESFELLGELRAPAYGAEANRTACIGIVDLENGFKRVEFNSADCHINPFLVFALLLEAGLYGVGAGLKSKGKKFILGEELPRSLGEALDCAEKSEWLRSVLSDKILEEFVRIKRTKIVAEHTFDIDV